MKGATGNVDDNRPGWRNGAYNFNFWAPVPDAQKGSTFDSGRWDNGFHVPSKGEGDPVIPNWGRGDYNGQPGFYFTSHFDSGSPFHRGILFNPIGFLKHMDDVINKTDHGC